MSEEILFDELSADEVARQYAVALESVDLINYYAALGLDSLDDEQTAEVDRNVRHLEIMVSRPYWTTQDLTPLNDAIALIRS